MGRLASHDDHCRVAPALREAVQAPILMHPDDRPLWELTHGGPDNTESHLWDVDLTDGQTIDVGGTTLRVLHTPGHAPGASTSKPLLRTVRTSPLFDEIEHDATVVVDRVYEPNPANVSRYDERFGQYVALYDSLVPNFAVGASVMMRPTFSLPALHSRRPTAHAGSAGARSDARRAPGQQAVQLLSNGGAGCPTPDGSPARRRRRTFFCNVMYVTSGRLSDLATQPHPVTADRPR